MACLMRRKDHPSFPNAITCCFLSSLKTLLMPREPTKASLGVNVLDFPMAGFQPTLYGRFWVTPEALRRRHTSILPVVSPVHFDVTARLAVPESLGVVSYSRQPPFFAYPLVGRDRAAVCRQPTSPGIARLPR